MADTDLLTPAEAAVVAEMTVRQVNKLIDEELPARAVRRRGGRRFVTASGAACLMARKDMSGLLTVAARRRLFRALLGGDDADRLALTETLTVDSAAIRQEVRSRGQRLRRLRSLVESDPETLGGRPCFKGTRIPVAQIAELLAQGADADELLEDYPALTRAMIEAAPILAKAYPARGRPRSRPWAKEEPISETRSPRG